MRRHPPEPAGEPAAARPVAVVAAMPEEIAPLLERLAGPRVLDVGPCRAHCGRLGRTEVVVAHTGEGRTRAENGVAALLDRFRPRLAVFIGVAGGLEASLEPGSLVVAREVLDGRTAVAPPDPVWAERALRAAGARAVAGTALSAARILCTPSSKAEARAGLPEGGVATVDLESAACARVAAGRGVPYVVIRAVCDTAGEELPLDLERCRDASGGVRRLRVVREALFHPSCIRGLWRLRRRLGSCARELAHSTERLLDGGEST